MPTFKIVDFEYVGDKRIGAMRYQGEFDSLQDAIEFAINECGYTPEDAFDIINVESNTTVYRG